MRGGPYLNFEWFAGLLEGVNWIHITGHWHAHSKLSSANAHMQHGYCLSPGTFVHKQTGGSEMGTLSGLGQELSHASTNANTALSHIP